MEGVLHMMENMALLWHTNASILWHIDFLLGIDPETNDDTTAVAMQQHGKHASTIIEVLLETVLGRPCNSVVNTPLQ
jgi:hypothetical protein